MTITLISWVFNCKFYVLQESVHVLTWAIFTLNARTANAARRVVSGKSNVHR